MSVIVTGQLVKYFCARRVALVKTVHDRLVYIIMKI